MGEQSGLGCSFTHILALLLKEADEDCYTALQRDGYEIRSQSFWKEEWRKEKKIQLVVKFFVLILSLECII